MISIDDCEICKCGCRSKNFAAASCDPDRDDAVLVLDSEDPIKKQAENRTAWR